MILSRAYLLFSLTQSRENDEVGREVHIVPVLVLGWSGMGSMAAPKFPPLGAENFFELKFNFSSQVCPKTSSISQVNRIQDEDGWKYSI